MTLRTQPAAPQCREVMVVDDDADVRCALVEYLSAEGISSFQAVDGLEALERVQSGSTPCAIVLDVDMPRLSGPALVTALRADSTLPRIPVLTMTAGAAPPGVDADGHLAKPFAPESMLAALFRVCRSCAACDREGPLIGSIFASRQRADLSGKPA